MEIWPAPFLGRGVAMGLAGLLDGGKSPWWCLLFFLPFINWLFIATLAVLPSAPRPQHAGERVETHDRLRAVLLGICGSLLIGAVSFGLHVLFLKQYSFTVFLGTPFTIGAVSGLIYNRRESRSAAATV